MEQRGHPHAHGLSCTRGGNEMLLTTARRADLEPVLCSVASLPAPGDGTGLPGLCRMLGPAPRGLQTPGQLPGW